MSLADIMAKKKAQKIVAEPPITEAKPETSSPAKAKLSFGLKIQKPEEDTPAPAADTEPQATIGKKISLFAKPSVMEEKEIKEIKPTGIILGRKTAPVEITSPTLGEMRMEEIKSAQDFQFPDQTEEISDEAFTAFQSAIDFLQANLDHREAVQESVKTIILQLRENPAMEAILKPEHMGLMVEGVRRAYGFAAAKTSARKDKQAANHADLADALKMFDAV